MTIIDAWNAAKVGQQIRNGHGTILIKRESGGDPLVSALIGCVVKTPHKEEMKMGTVRRQSLILLRIPDEANVTIEWEE